MSDPERLIYSHIKDSGVVIESESTLLQTVSFHQIPHTASFGIFATSAGDMGGMVVNQHFGFAMPINDQPNLIWDTGDGCRRRDNVQNGEVFIYLPYRPTYVCNEQDMEFVVLFLDPVYLHASAHETIDPDRIEVLGEGCLHDPLLNGVLNTLRQGYERYGKIDRLYGETLATVLCVHTLRNYTTLRPSLIDLTEHGLGQSLLRQALEYINDHLNEDLSLRDIADSVSLSSDYFLRLFKQSTGQTPRQYVIAQRVEKAKSLLRRGRMTINEVAQAVGFYDHAHLIRHFKRSTGVTPSEFRR